MVEMQQRLMLCEHGDCVDVSKVKCDEKFTNVDEIIACEEMQKMTWGEIKS